MMATLRTSALVLLCFLAVSLPLKVSALEEIKELTGTEGHLAQASIPATGPSLVAWKATDLGRSRLEIYEGSTLARTWNFDDILIKGVQWLEVGRTFRIDLVGLPEGWTESRLYEIQPAGGLFLLGSTRDLERHWGEVSLSLDGELWVASTIEGKSAQVAIGRTGTTDPVWFWNPSAELHRGDGDSGDEFAFATVLGDSENPVIAFLWGGQLTLNSPSETGVVDVEPPGDCTEIQTYEQVGDGFWVQCYRGMHASPSHLQGFYALDDLRTDFPLEARALGAFGAPWYRPNGIVVDLHRKLRSMTIYAVVPGEPEARKLGKLKMPLPNGSYWRPAGDALLQSSGTEERYLVRRLQSEILRLLVEHDLPEVH